MDLVNKLSLENGRLFACVAKRDEHLRHYRDGQRCFQLENVYDNKFSRPLRERRMSMEQQPGEGIGEGVPSYPGMLLLGRLEVCLHRLRRLGSTGALILGRLRGSGFPCDYTALASVCP